MTARSVIFFILATVFSFSVHAQNAGVQVDFKLSPAGSFSAKTTKVKGYAVVNGDTVTAENVEVDITSLDTANGLRTTHVKDRLESTKYPTAKVIKAQGKGGKGTATIEVKGIQKEVSGTYKITGKKFVGQFPVSLDDFKIKDPRYMGIGVKDAAIVNVNLPVK